MYTKTDFISAQLKAIAPDADWQMSGVDRATELARILERHGITDLWALQLIPAQGLYHVPAWTEYITQDSTINHPAKDEVRDGYAFLYYGVQFGYLGTPERADNFPLFEKRDIGYMLAWSSAGHGNVSYCVRPNAKKQSLEIVPVWGSSSDAADIRTAAIVIISFFAFTALPMAGVSVGNAIGSAVLPASFSAAYPGLTTAIGNIALSTALNGGDVEKAVKNATLSAASGTAGEFVGSAAQLATDSQLIGTLADVATRTAIVGGDIKTAVAFEAAKYGVGLMDNPAVDWFAPSGSAFGDSFGWSNEVDFGTSLDFGDGLNFSDPFANPFIDFNLPDTGGNVFDFDTDTLTSGPAFDEYQFNPFLDAASQTAVNAAVTPSIVPPPAPSNPPPPNSPVYSPTNIVQGITTAALAAINVIKAYRSLDAPTIQPTARVVRPDGSVSAIGSNGLIQTRGPNGQITASRPPVGIPQATVDGNYIVNNGDGSYSVVSPTGQTARYSYSPTSAGGFELSPTMIAAGAALLVVLLKGK